MAVEVTTGGSLLPSFQSRLYEQLKARGMIPMSTGVTRKVADAGDYSSLMAGAVGEVGRAATMFGSRTMDRYSTDVGSSYREQRFQFLSSLEGFKTKAYADAGGVSVGLGFHMDKSGARDVWKQAFGNTVSYDDVKSGKAQLTKAQVKTLFDHDVLSYEKLVDKAANGQPLTQSQRVALLSVAYNAPKRFQDYVAPLVSSGQLDKVPDAILTQTFNPNHPNIDAIKARRYQEASTFLSVTEAPDVMPTFDVYKSAVAVSQTTGVANLKAVGVADVRDMNPEFQARLANLIDAAPANIKNGLGVYSGYRSVAHQTELWNAALKKYGSAAEARKWVAPPGHSNHNKGLAADVSYNGQSLAKAPADVVKWVHDNAPKYGLTVPLANENWHIEPVEARQGGVLVPLAHLKPIGSSAPQPMPGRPAALAGKSSLPSNVAAAVGHKENPKASDPHVDTLAKHLLTQYDTGGKPIKSSTWSPWAASAFDGTHVTVVSSKSAVTEVVHKNGTVTKTQLSGTTQLPQNVTVDPKTGKVVKEGGLVLSVAQAVSGVSGKVSGSAILTAPKKTAPPPSDAPSWLTSAQLAAGGVTEQAPVPRSRPIGLMGVSAPKPVSAQVVSIKPAVTPTRTVAAQTAQVSAARRDNSYSAGSQQAAQQETLKALGFHGEGY